MTRYFAALKYTAKSNMKAINKGYYSSVLGKLAQTFMSYFYLEGAWLKP
jgi:hypothetical protein